LNRYKLIISYDGTKYYGWQGQKELPSVAATLESSFQKVFHHAISIRGASRTDAGVHALGQVATFKTELAIDTEQLKHAWNNRLHSDIVIRSIEQVALDHNIYANIAHKTYYYHFFLERPLPFLKNFGWYLDKPVDIEKLKTGLQTFVGTHDFKSFCSSEDTRENTIRTIESIQVTYIKRFGVYRIAVTGPAFLRHMIRRIVGAALTVAYQHNTPISALKEALEKKNPVQILPNAPAHGLLLYKIKYRNHHEQK